FWGIEFKLIAATQYDNNTERMYFRFEQTSDSLKITQAFINHGHQDNGEDGGDIPLTEVTNDLRYYGINNLPEGFAKEALSGSKMILRSKT
ncbi:lipocalin-like domain-containing protein, partial [Acinetobacter baumannii]